MDLIVLGLLLCAFVAHTLGFLLVTTIVVVLWYGKEYSSSHETWAHAAAARINKPRLAQNLIVPGLVFATLVLIPNSLLAIFAAVFFLWYGKHYHSGEECRYTGRLFQPTWRRARFWRLVQRLLRYKRPVLPSSFPPGPILFSAQPHGMFAISSALAVFSGDFDRPGSCTVMVVHNWYWWVPGLRDLMLALGCISKRRESIVHAVCSGFSVTVLPGGVFEMGPPVLPMPPILGIVKLCKHELADSVPLVPVFMRGEAETCCLWHDEPRWLKRFRAWTLRNLGVGIGALFTPRLWDWPVLEPRLANVLFPTAFQTAAKLQEAYTTAMLTVS